MQTKLLLEDALKNVGMNCYTIKTWVTVPYTSRVLNQWNAATY